MVLDKFKFLVAHRGDHESAPENSLRSLKTAINSGAKFVEFDVQLSRDLVPFMLHDANLFRTTGRDINILKTTSRGLDKIHLLDKAKVPQEYMPSLSQTVDMLNSHEKLKAFIELKTQSIAEFGINKVLDKVLDVLKDAKFKYVLISYNAELVSAAKTCGIQTGWVSDYLDSYIIKRVDGLNADCLFTSYKSVLNFNNFGKDFKLAVFTVNSVDLVKRLLQYEVDLIETDLFSRLVKNLKNA